MRERVVLDCPPAVGDPLDTVNTREELVGDHDLPDPLRFEDGTSVTADSWGMRRAQTLALFEDHVYGRTPDAETTVAAEALESGPSGDADAVRHQTRLTVTTERGSLLLDLLLLLPSGADGPVPVFVVANFDGNHTISDDPAIQISAGASRDRGDDVGPRGSKVRRFPVAAIIERGFGLATFYSGDADPDRDDGFVNGAHPLYYEAAQTEPAADEWGTIGAWAWGCSRVLDHLLTTPGVDGDRVIVGGHSRLGKTALWAAAQDERFAAAFSNDSGCAGAALSRRRFGENVAVINALFPHWFCRNYRCYSNNENALPVDQHQLLALLAPRPVHVGSASDDLWADPRGEFLATETARPVFDLVGGAIEHHVRAGEHDLLAEDWAHYLDFAEQLG